MPEYTDSMIVPASAATVFAFLRDPRNALRLAPPELHLEITSAPPLLEVGARLEFKGRRWGISRRSVLEIIALEEGKLLREVQRAGPFREWERVQRFEAVGEMATRLTDEVTFEPPGGMLGLVVNVAFVQRELAALFAYRKQRLHELFRPAPASADDV
jgi:ligand-binding SRPBCC domain-containing protein